MTALRQHYMGDLRSILLCTDGSDFSTGAIHAAINLAHECRSLHLIVLRVLDFNPEFETDGHEYAEKEEMAARDHLEHIRKIAADQNVKCKVVVRRAEANPYRAIIEEDKRWKADLIVMGRRGHKGFKKVMMGSVTAKIIATSRCNVLIVPRHAVMKAEHVLLATDGSKCSKAAEQEAISLCMSCHHLKSFTALSVIPAAAKLAEAERILNSVKQAAAGRGISAETISARGRPDEAIVETAHRLGIDIIIMGTHGRRGMEKLLKGSVSERVVSLSPCAVLIVKI